MNFVTNLARRGAGLTPTLTPRAMTEPHFNDAPQPSAEHARDNAAVISEAPRVEPSPLAAAPTLPNATTLPPAPALPRVIEREQPREEATSRAAPSLSASIEPYVIPTPPTTVSSPANIQAAPRAISQSTSRVEATPSAIEPRREISDGAREPDLAVTPPAHSFHPVATRETRDDAAPDTHTLQPPSARVLIEPRAPEIFERATLAPRVNPTAIASSEATAPRIHVRIGQVQVRVQKPSPSAPRSTAPPRTARGFDEFARARAYVDRIY